MKTSARRFRLEDEREAILVAVAVGESDATAVVVVGESDATAVVVVVSALRHQRAGSIDYLKYQRAARQPRVGSARTALRY